MTTDTMRAATSADGTTIGYRQFGRGGPGVVLLHGAMSSSYNHVQLAEALADNFTVYVLDRRGRGLSGPYRDDHTVGADVDDLTAVLSATGAHNVFGCSSGAIVVLEAALTLPAIRRAVAFEPPLFADDQVPRAILTRFDREIAKGKVAGALATGMKGAQMGPAVFNVLPRWLLERLTAMAMAQEDKRGTNGYVPMRTLAPTLHYDFDLVTQLSGPLERYTGISADTLLLGASKSPTYLKRALDALEKLLPGAERVELSGVGHAAPWNSDRGGQPAQVAHELRRFFFE
jgi:pimeloyl-ACP methyl ester carboxylesterase